MIALLVAAFAVQAGGWVARPAAPTVGDTVVLERLVPAPAGVVGRARPLNGTELIEPLGPPQIVPTAGGLLVRYTVALFATGRQTLPMPALELVYPDGAVELVLGDSASVDVWSVIPDTVVAPEPQPSRAPVPRVARRPEPLVGLLLAAGALLAGWAVLRRRGGRPATAPQEAPQQAPELPLMHWLAAGERRAVATLAAERLRGRIEQLIPAAGRGLALTECLALVEREQPGWPLAEIERVLAALDRARFAPLTAEDAAELVDRADVLLERLGPASAGGAP